MLHLYTTRQVADLVGCREWQVRRLFEQNELPEPFRFGNKRAIPRERLPEIIDALRVHNWLPTTEPAK